MPPKAKTVCRVGGCDNPRHVYPAGDKAVYCTAHLYLKKTSRKGEDLITGPMRDVLHYLLEAKRSDAPFQELKFPLAHGITIKRLIARDWVFQSDGIDHLTKYVITQRGEEMLAYYETMINRPDGICPMCGVAERHVRSGGHRDAYCIECLRKRSVIKRARGGDIGDVHRMCSRCHKRPRHQYPGGKYSTYCKHCATVNRRRNARKERRRLIKSVKAGGAVPMCQLCKVRPRRVFINSISNYCDACLPTYMRKMKFKRRLQVHFPYQRV